MQISRGMCSNRKPCHTNKHGENTLIHPTTKPDMSIVVEIHINTLKYIENGMYMYAHKLQEYLNSFTKIYIYTSIIYPDENACIIIEIQPNIPADIHTYCILIFS